MVTPQFFEDSVAYRHWRMSCTRRRVKTEHLVARAIFLSLVVSSTRTPEHFSVTHVRVAQVCTSHSALVMFGVVCTIAHPKHLFILDVSSPSSRSPSWVVHLVFLHTIAATSDNVLYETGEGNVDWNQVPLKRNFAGETVWLSGRLNPFHKRTDHSVRSNGWTFSDLCDGTSQGSTSLVRKSCQEYSSDTHWLRVNLEGRYFGCRHWAGKNWTRQKSTLEGSMQRKW